jgi:hypothetical protein
VVQARYVMRVTAIIAVAIVLTLAVFGIFWAGAYDFGMRQAVEFFPYVNQIELEGQTIRSSGVVVRVNDRAAASTDRDVAILMRTAREMYPDECSGENWEVAVRRPGIDGTEERFSFRFTVLTPDGEPQTTLEVGHYLGGHYVIDSSRPAGWEDVEEGL